MCIRDRLSIGQTISECQIEDTKTKFNSFNIGQPVEFYCGFDEDSDIPKKYGRVWLPGIIIAITEKWHEVDRLKCITIEIDDATADTLSSSLPMRDHKFEEMYQNKYLRRHSFENSSRVNIEIREKIANNALEIGDIVRVKTDTINNVNGTINSVDDIYYGVTVNEDLIFIPRFDRHRCFFPPNVVIKERTSWTIAVDLAAKRNIENTQKRIGSVIPPPTNIIQKTKGGSSSDKKNTVTICMNPDHVMANSYWYGLDNDNKDESNWTRALPIRHIEN